MIAIYDPHIHRMVHFSSTLDFSLRHVEGLISAVHDASDERLMSYERFTNEDY